MARLGKVGQCAAWLGMVRHGEVGQG